MLLKYLLKFDASLRNQSCRNLLASNFKKEIAALFHRRSCAVICGAPAATCAVSFQPFIAQYSDATRQHSARTLPISVARSVVEIAPRESSTLNRCEHFKQKSYAARIGAVRSAPPAAFVPLLPRIAFASLSHKSNISRVRPGSAHSKLYAENCCSSARRISPYVTSSDHRNLNTLSTFCRNAAILSSPYVSSHDTGSRSMPPDCWKYVNCVISNPSSNTRHPTPRAPSVGDRQLSSSKRTSWCRESIPIAR